MHIGLIGGIGPAASEFYYRKLVEAHAAAGHDLDLTIVQGQARDLVENLTAGNPHRQAEIFNDLLQRLQAAGAEAAAVTSMGGHFCIAELLALSPLPLVNLIPEMASRLTHGAYKRIGIIGTRTVMESRIYGAIPSLEVALPEGEALEATHQAYIAMATAGRATDEQRDLFYSVGAELVERHGAEVVVLGGTDLCLAFDGYDCGFAVIDSAQVHVDALARASIEGKLEA